MSRVMSFCTWCDEKHYAMGLCKKHYYQDCYQSMKVKESYKHDSQSKERREAQKRAYQKWVKKNNRLKVKEGVLDAAVRGDTESLFSDPEFLRDMGLSCSLKKED